MENQIPPAPQTLPPPQPIQPITHSHKKMLLIIVGISVIILLGIIFLPLPYYQNATGVCDAPSPSDCPTSGWKWTKSLYNLYSSN